MFMENEVKKLLYATLLIAIYNLRSGDLIDYPTDNTKPSQANNALGKTD